MVTVVAGALLGWAFSGALISWGIVTTAFGAIMLGASLGSLFVSRDIGDFSTSPTYSFGPISNTMSQLVPIPVIYGRCRVAGNIIYQAFADDKKEEQDLYILVGEGPVTAINDVMANDQYPVNLDDCSVTTYLNTTAATHDGRDPSGVRPYPDDVALICLTLKAQEKLNGTPTVTSIVDGVRVWTPSGFTWSRNPIWIILDILCHPRYGLGYGTVMNGVYQHPDWDKIDYACAVAAAAYCDGVVSYGRRFQLDFTLDTQRPIRDVLADFLATCRGYLVETDKLQICIDAPVSIYSREITPDNITEDSFTFWQSADEDVCNRITIDWIDPDNSYERVTDVFQDSVDIADRGVVEKSISMLPVTRSGQVGHMGYYLLKTSLLVRNFCSFGVGLKDCDIQPGEVLLVTFEEFTGWNKKPFRVVSVRDGGQDIMVVTCSEYIADVYDDSVLDITHHIDTSLTMNYKPNDVTELTITEQLETMQDGGYSLIAKITWTPPASYDHLELWYRYSSEVSWKPAGTLPRGSEEYYLPCTEKIGDTLYVKIYVVSRLGVRSDGQTISKILRGDLTPPAPPTNLQGTGGFRMATLTWTDPGDGDLDHIDIYRSLESDTAEMTKIGSAPRFAQEYIDGNLGVLQTAWYRLKAVDVAGNQSVYSAVVSTTSEALQASDLPDGTIQESHLSAALQTEIGKISGIESDIVDITADIADREAQIRSDVGDIKDALQGDIALVDQKADSIAQDLSELSGDTAAAVSRLDGDISAAASRAAENLAAAKAVLRGEAKALTDEITEQLNLLADAAVGALEMVRDIGDRLSDAGVYVDPDSGEVRIYGLDVLRRETDVRISNAEILLDAQDVAIRSKAESTVVQDHTARITRAEADLQGLDAAIALKASALELAEAIARIAAAELRIDAQNGTISAYAGQYEEDFEALAEGVIQNAVNQLESDKAARQAIAFAKQELVGRLEIVNGQLEAEAASRLELEAQIKNAAASLIAERELRVRQDEAIATLIDSVFAEVDNNRAAIIEEAEIRADNDEAYGRENRSLIAAVEEAAGEAAIASLAAAAKGDEETRRQIAGFYSDLDARIKENEVAEATQREALVAQMNANKALIETERHVRATGEEALAERIDNVFAEVGDARAAITEEATARADQYESLATAIDSISAEAGFDKQELLDAIAAEETARIAAIEAEAAARGRDLTAEEQARIAAIQQEAADRTAAINAAVGEETRQRTAAIQAESEARSRGLETYGRALMTVFASSKESEDDAGEALIKALDSNEGALSEQKKLLAAHYESLDARVTELGVAEAEDREALIAQINETKAAIQREQYVRADKDEAIARDIQSLLAEIGSTTAAIIAEQQARADGDTAVANSVTSLSATVENNKNTAAAAVQSEATARANADGALSDRIDTLVSDVGGAMAAITTEAQTRAGKDEAYGRQSAAMIAASDADAGEAALGAAKLASDIERDLTEQFAVYYSTLDTRIKQGLLSEAQARELMAARLASAQAAIETERTVRADANSALARRVSTVEAKAGDNEAAIQTLSEVTAGKPNVYNQTTVPAGTTDDPLKLGDLWINSNNEISRWTGTTWVKCSDKDLTDFKEQASAASWIKTQVSSGGRKVIAGLGVLADSGSGSEIVMLADRFYIVKDRNGALVQPFAVDATDPNNPKIVINGNLFVQALKDGGYADATGWIIGNKIAAGSRIQLGAGGEFIAGSGAKFQMGNGAVYIDSETAQLMLRDPENISRGDYIRIVSGDISTYKYIGGAYREMKSLRKMSFGSNVENGTTVTLDGYWPSAPNIIVSPCALQTFNPAYSTQAQTLLTQASDLVFNRTTGKVTFKPVAKLVINAGRQVVNPDIATVYGQVSAAYVDPNTQQEVYPEAVLQTNSVSVPANATTVTVRLNIFANCIDSKDVYEGAEGGEGHSGEYLYSQISSIWCRVRTAYVIDGVEYEGWTKTFSAADSEHSYRVNFLTSWQEPSAKTFTLSASANAHTVSAKIYVTQKQITSYNDEQILRWQESSPPSLIARSFAALRIEQVAYNLAAAEPLAQGTLNYMAIAE